MKDEPQKFNFWDAWYLDEQGKEDRLGWQKWGLVEDGYDGGTKENSFWTQG